MAEDIKLAKKTEKIKRFYCCTKELCYYKNEWASNDRCFAPYAIRSSCPNIRRQNGRSWKQGSKERNEFIKQEE